MIRSAPSWRADGENPEDADRAIADDGDGLTGPDSAATATNQPVPSTSDAASILRACASVGSPGTLTRVPAASGILDDTDVAARPSRF